MTLLTNLDSPAEREWYAQQTVLQGWSRSTLELDIKSRLQRCLLSIEYMSPSPEKCSRMAEEATV